VPVNATTQYVLGGGAPLNPALLFEPTIQDVDDEWDQWEPKVTITWDAVESTTLFASWGVGFKSGGFNNQGSQATVDFFINGLLGTDLVIKDQYDEETSNAFEIGFKSTFSDRFYLDGAVFYTKVDDMQFFEFLVGPFGLLRVVSNIDEVEIKGFELGANTIVTDWLQVYGGFSYVDSEIEENNSRPITEGNESPYTPEFTLNLATEIDFPITGNLDFVGGAYVTWVGDTWFHTVQDNDNTTFFELLLTAPPFNIPAGIGTANYDRTRRDDYVTLDLRVGVAGDGWEVIVFGNNVTDEDHLEENITAPEFGGSFIHPGAESRWGLQLIVEL
jgi:iron complex outermembrane receptor protein